MSSSTAKTQIILSDNFLLADRRQVTSAADPSNYSWQKLSVGTHNRQDNDLLSN